MNKDQDVALSRKFWSARHLVQHLLLLEQRLSTDFAHIDIIPRPQSSNRVSTLEHRRLDKTIPNNTAPQFLNSLSIICVPPRPYIPGQRSLLALVSLELVECYDVNALNGCSKHDSSQHAYIKVRVSTDEHWRGY